MPLINLGLLLRRIRNAVRSMVWSLQPAVVLAPSRQVYRRSHVSGPPEGSRVLDIGSGNDPFPGATVLADRYLEPSVHRADRFQDGGLPVVICDAAALPFADDAFDFVVCSHVLEHVSDPIGVCREMCRVAPAGFIETPSLMKDALFAWASGMHRWHVVKIAKRLCFFEYDARQARGIGTGDWQSLIHGASFHPLQDAFVRNQDLFNVLFEWRESFEVMVFRLDGTVEREAVSGRPVPTAGR